MKNHWHGQIQRYVDGLSSETDAAALQAALSEDAGLRSLYLDYMNLDIALRTAAEMEAVTVNGPGPIAIFPTSPARLFPRSSRSLAVAAACAVLIVWAVLAIRRHSSPERLDLASTISSTQNAVARLSIQAPTCLPAWMSPTASLLEPSQIPK